MAVPNSINDLSTTPSGNGPNGATETPSSLDDYQRAIQAILKSECGALAAVGGTPDVITLTTTPSFGASPPITAGKEIWFVATGTNTTNVTVNINGIGAVAVKKNGITTLVAGDIPAGAVVCIKYDGTQFQLINAASLPVASSANSAFLTNLLYPSQDGRWRDIYRSGWLPNINQQWGGVWYGQIFDCVASQYKDVEVLFGNVQDDSVQSNVGSAAGTFYKYQPFKVGKSVANPQIVLKLLKVANPTDNFTVGIWSDNAGVPNALLGGNATLSGKLITSKAEGEDYVFSPTPGTLTAGTQYHIVCSKSVGVDATNFYSVKLTTNSNLPVSTSGAGTSAPVWTPQASRALCFKVLAPAAVSFLQSGGRFDQKLVFSGATSPIDLTDYLWQPLKNFWDGKQFTSLIRVTAPTVSQPLKDFQYGIDHDRILVSINASGFAQVDVWDSGGTKRTVTGAASIATGDHDVGFSIRSVGDGSDYIRLFVDGASVGTPLTGLTLTFDPAFREAGHATLGGALSFAVPTWSGSSITSFSALPSTLGWAFGGTGTEANGYSVSGGKLYQNADGLTSAQTGNYTKTSAGLSNTNGWTVSAKLRVSSDQNLINVVAPVSIGVQDGTKVIAVRIHEYFLSVDDAVTTQFIYQGDFKSSENVFTLSGKGSDYYLYLNGRLIIDGTGKLSTTASTNSIAFGDTSATAGDNSDAVWSYVKYYNNAILLPQFTSASVSENLEFSGNRESLLTALWNSGSPASGKSYLGIGKNYVDEVATHVELRRDTTTPPSGTITTTATTDVVCPEMESYVIGSDLTITATNAVYNNTALQGVRNNIYADGTILNNNNATFVSATANASGVISITNRKRTLLALHKAENRWSVNANTGNSGGRLFNVEAKP